MTDEELDQYWARQRAHNAFVKAEAWKRAEARERSQDRQAKIKHVRELLNRDGFYAVLRQFAEGADTIKREDQLRILKIVDDAVQAALPHERRRQPKRRPARVKPDPRTRIEKLQALAADPAAATGERTAAQQAVERLRQQLCD
jgi:hypothetical protein